MSASGEKRPNPYQEGAQLVGNKKSAKAQPPQSPQASETGQTHVVHSYNIALHSHDAVKNSDGSFEWVKQNGWVRTPRDTDIIRLQFVYGFASLRNYYTVNQTNDRIMMRMTTLDINGDGVGCIGPMRIRHGMYDRKQLDFEMQRAFDEVFRSSLNAINAFAGTPRERVQGKVDGIFSRTAKGGSLRGKNADNVITVCHIADGHEYGNIDLSKENEVREDLVDNYRNVTGHNHPFPKVGFARSPASETTFPVAYYWSMQGGAIGTPPYWYTQDPQSAKGVSNRAMFSFVVNLHNNATRQPISPIGTCPRVEDADLAISRSAGVSVDFFYSASAPQGVQVFGAYGRTASTDSEFLCGFTEPFVNETVVDRYHRPLGTGFSRAAKRESVWVVDHEYKIVNTESEVYESRGAGYSPLKAMATSEGSNEIYVRMGQINNSNLQTPYFDEGQDEHRTQQVAHPSDIVGVLHMQDNGEYATSTYSDASGSDHSNQWFMILADKRVTRFRVRITDVAKNNIAALEDHPLGYGTLVPFALVLRADVLRNLDQEKNQSQPTARGVTPTPAHTYLADTTVAGSNAHPYSNKPVF